MTAVVETLEHGRITGADLLRLGPSLSKYGPSSTPSEVGIVLIGIPGLEKCRDGGNSTVVGATMDTGGCSAAAATSGR
ncbi:MAG: hypothetical protein ABI822_18680 [Bryobacteraceae bacterium]